jgi:Zn finger protein HypA/HybF involved in hydrogenase expression
MSSQHRAKQTNTGAINMKCKDCNSNEGTLLKEFDSEQIYSWYDISEMTEICASCGSENIEIEQEQ